MLCKNCRRLIERGAAVCGACGRPLYGGAVALDLVLRDGTRIPVYGSLTIGRGAGNDVQIGDRTVSRRHAVVSVDGHGAHLEDAGSSHGTFVDGRKLEGRERLDDGAVIAVGDVELRAERRRLEEEAGRTIVVRPGASVLMPAVGASEVAGAGTSFGFRPRLRSGWALKRLPASEGDRRYVLKDLDGGEFVRMGDDEAALFQLLRGDSALPELVAEAERRFGARGPGRLAGLLADLGDRGMLAGTERNGGPPTAPRGRLARLFRPRTRVVSGADRWFKRIYESGGFVVFTRPALTGLAAVVVAGIGAFAFLIERRYGTPFVVAKKIGVGGLVFMLGRFFVVSLHELAHGLLLTAFGRRIERAGFRLLFVFPYAFVDTSDAWFEPRARRVAISAAGPASDLVVGGSFALAAALGGAGTIRDIFFNLALAAYVGAFFNLNPFLDRDGYNMLVDVLGEPGLRRRSKEWLAAALSGKQRAGRQWTLAAYSVAALVWSVLGAGFAILISMRYYDRLVHIAPRGVLWTVFGAFYALLFLPVVVSVGKPLWQRRRSRDETEVESVAV